jgi:hypothetical protein
MPNVGTIPNEPFNDHRFLGDVAGELCWDPPNLLRGEQTATVKLTSRSR